MLKECQTNRHASTSQRHFSKKKNEKNVGKGGEVRRGKRRARGSEKSGLIGDERKDRAVRQDRRLI